ncbi:MAG: LysR family transcriptional regulator [Polyangiaceae bacterium]
MDRLTGLRVFCRVVERGSFSAVARELGISQPNASRHVAELESRLGTRLLLRTTRRVSPTDAGRALYERASRAVSELLDAENEVSAGLASLSGPLRISAPGAFGRRFVLPVVAAFLREHERVEVELLLSDRPIDLIGEGIDLAVRITAPGFGTVVHRKLGQLAIVLVAAPSYLERRGVPRSVADVNTHDAVFHTDTRAHLAALVARGALAAPPEFRVRLVCDDVEAVHDAVLAGLGIAPIAKWLVADDLRSGRLVPVLPEFALPEVPVFAVFPAGRQHSARLEAFVRELGRALPRLPDA